MSESTTSLLLAPTLASLGDDPRQVMNRLNTEDFRALQLSATASGLRPRDLDQSARRDVRATLKRNELSLSGIDLWIPVEHFLDPAHLDRALGATREAIELAADLGRCPLSMNLPRPDAGDENNESPAESLETIAGYAAHFGVEIADHSEAALKREQFGLGIDPAACLSRDEDPVSIVTSNPETLVSARLCDLLRSGMRGPVGDKAEGRLDVMAYRRALSVGGYARPVVVDTRQWSDPWVGLDQTKRVWEAMEALG